MYLWEAQVNCSQEVQTKQRQKEEKNPGGPPSSSKLQCQCWVNEGKWSNESCETSLHDDDELHGKDATNSSRQWEQRQRFRCHQRSPKNWKTGLRQKALASAAAAFKPSTRALPLEDLNAQKETKDEDKANLCDTDKADKKEEKQEHKTGEQFEEAAFQALLARKEKKKMKRQKERKRQAQKQRPKARQRPKQRQLLQRECVKRQLRSAMTMRFRLGKTRIWRLKRTPTLQSTGMELTALERECWEWMMSRQSCMQRNSVTMPLSFLTSASHWRSRKAKILQQSRTLQPCPSAQGGMGWALWDEKKCSKASSFKSQEWLQWLHLTTANNCYIHTSQASSFKEPDVATVTWLDHS